MDFLFFFYHVFHLTPIGHYLFGCCTRRLYVQPSPIAKTTSCPLSLSFCAKTNKTNTGFIESCLNVIITLLAPLDNLG